MEEASALAGASLFFISNTSISGGVELMRILNLQDWSGVERVLQIDRFWGAEEAGHAFNPVSKLGGPRSEDAHISRARYGHPGGPIQRKLLR
jgi:hypothetical protein